MAYDMKTKIEELKDLFKENDVKFEELEQEDGKYRVLHLPFVLEGYNLEVLVVFGEDSLFHEMSFQVVQGLAVEKKAEVLELLNKMNGEILGLQCYTQEEEGKLNVKAMHVFTKEADREYIMKVLFSYVGFIDENLLKGLLKIKYN